MFLEKFANDKTPAMLLKELGSLNMEGKEKVKEFNKSFMHILNKFVADKTSSFHHCSLLHVCIVNQHYIVC